MEKIREQQVCPEADRSLDVNGTKVHFGARSLETIATEIKCCQDSVDQSYLKIGQLLLEAKKLFGKYGDWTDWLQKNVDFSVCRAQRLMRIAKWLDEKTAPVPLLPFSHAYILCQLSPEDLERFLEGKQVGTMSKRQLQKAVSDYLRQKANKAPTVATTAQHQITVSEEDELRQRLKKLRNDMAQIVDLIKKNPSYVTFADELRDLVIQQLAPEDFEDD